jgi:transporter family protein
MKNQGIFFAMVTFVFWGFAAFMDKVSATKIGTRGVWIWTVSAAISLVVFLIYILFFNTSYSKIGLWYMFIGLVCTSLGGLSYYLVFTRSQVSTGAPLTALYPILTVLLGVLFLKEKLSGSQVAGVSLGLISIYLLAR